MVVSRCDMRAPPGRYRKMAVGKMKLQNVRWLRCASPWSVAAVAEIVGCEVVFSPLSEDCVCQQGVCFYRDMVVCRGDIWMLLPEQGFSWLRTRSLFSKCSAFF